MGKPYAIELENLSHTYAWSLRTSVAELAGRIQGSARSPLFAIGSGGSFTAACFGAYLHQVCTGQVAKALTPLEMVYAPVDLRHLTLLMLTAGGRNPDIVGAFTRLVEREPRALTVVCTRSQSPLAQLAATCKNARVFEFDIPTGKDGYLATNSLLATLVLITRAYDDAGLLRPPLPGAFTELLSRDVPSDSFLEHLAVRAMPLWSRRTLVVLHTPATQAAAIDLESRFSEAALGNVQVTDYRNFAHGRHYWLAARQRTTALVAFVTGEVARLADRTLRLVPDEIPVLRVDLPDEGVQAALTAIIYSFYLAQFAGQASDIDPGRPAVPEFGRRLYRLRAFQTISERRSAISAAEAAAAERKSRRTIRALESCGELETWRAAYHSFVSGLLEARFTALVFDYDGTLCDAWERFEGPRHAVIEHLERLSRCGVLVGVATGRGQSVRQQLRQRMDRALWDRMPIAYHNGSEMGLLSDDSLPGGNRDPVQPLDSIYAVLAADPWLAEQCSIEPARRQLTITPYEARWSITELWESICTMIERHGFTGVKVFRSDHSVDVLEIGASKRAVLKVVQELVGGREAGAVLCIGDRGSWPGNDCELLCQPYALSVDETSLDPKTCWNIASPGTSNTTALLEYLSLLECQSGRAFFSAQRFKEIYT